MKNQSSSEIIRAHVFVSGRVQGVGFRYSTINEAKKCGASGWVRNLPDGRVEAVFEGSREVVETMVSWCKLGPRAAVVTGLDVKSEEPEGIEGFEARF